MLLSSMKLRSFSTRSNVTNIMTMLCACKSSKKLLSTLRIQNYSFSSWMDLRLRITSRKHCFLKGKVVKSDISGWWFTKVPKWMSWFRYQHFFCEMNFDYQFKFQNMITVMTVLYIRVYMCIYEWKCWNTIYSFLTRFVIWFFWKNLFIGEIWDFWLYWMNNKLKKEGWRWLPSTRMQSSDMRFISTIPSTYVCCRVSTLEWADVPSSVYHIGCFSVNGTSFWNWAIVEIDTHKISDRYSSVRTWSL